MFIFSGHLPWGPPWTTITHRRWQRDVTNYTQIKQKWSQCHCVIHHTTQSITDNSASHTRASWFNPTQWPHGSITLFKWPQCISMANERGRGSPLTAIMLRTYERTNKCNDKQSNNKWANEWTDRLTNNLTMAPTDIDTNELTIQPTEEKQALVT